MPQINVLGSVLTASGARTIVGSPSWQKLGASFIDHQGNEVPIPIEENLLDRFNELVAGWEKTSLLEKKQNQGYTSGIKDTFARQGPAKEWDHLVFSFSKDETASMTINAKQVYRQALIEAFNKAELENGQRITESGRRMLLVADGHDDTGNYHIHLLVHRFPVDLDKRYIGTGIDLRKYSIAAHQSMILTEILKEKDLVDKDTPMKVPWYGPTGLSISEDRAVSDSVKQAVTEMIETAGGQPSMDVRPGITAEDIRHAAQQATEEEGAEERPVATPEEKQIQQFIKIAEREVTMHAKLAQEAAQQVALGQQALSAIAERQRAEAELKKTIEEKEAVSQEKEKLAGAVTELQANLETVSDKLQETEQTVLRVGDFFKVAPLPEDVFKAPVTDQAQWLAGTFREVAGAFDAAQDSLPKQWMKEPIEKRVGVAIHEYISTSTQLENVTANVIRLKGDIDKLTQVNRDLDAQVKTRSKDLETAQTEIQHRTQENKKLALQVEKITQHGQELQKVVEEAQNAVKVFKHQAEEKAEMAKKYEEITAHQRNILDTQALELARTNGIISNYREEISKLDGYAGKLKGEVEKRDTMISTLQEQLAALKAQLAEAQRVPAAMQVSAKDEALTDQLLAEEKKEEKPVKKPSKTGPKE